MAVTTKQPPFQQASLSLGSLSDDDGNKNGKKAMGIDRQDNNFARASRFLVHFLAVAARVQREST